MCHFTMMCHITSCKTATGMRASFDSYGTIASTLLAWLTSRDIYVPFLRGDETRHRATSSLLTSPTPSNVFQAAPSTHIIVDEDNELERASLLPVAGVASGDFFGEWGVGGGYSPNDRGGWGRIHRPLLRVRMRLICLGVLPIAVSNPICRCRLWMSRVYPVEGTIRYRD
jgi:hypothetical protein